MCLCLRSHFGSKTHGIIGSTCTAAAAQRSTAHSSTHLRETQEGCNCVFYSERLEKAGTVHFRKHPARKVGARSQQCGPKVPGRFAFPGARNPRIFSISRFRNIFCQQFFPGLSRSFPQEPLIRPRKQPQPSRVFRFTKKTTTD